MLLCFDMGGRPWSKAEEERLIDVMNIGRFNRAREAYNRWAVHNGYHVRTAGALHQKAHELAVRYSIPKPFSNRRFEASTDWLEIGYVAKVLNVSRMAIHGWIKRGYIESKYVKFVSRRNKTRLIARKAFRQMAKSHPSLLWPYDTHQLITLLEEDNLVELVAAATPPKTMKNRYIKITCRERGLSFTTVKDAAKTIGVNHQYLSGQFNKGNFYVAGFHWTAILKRPDHQR